MAAPPFLPDETKPGSSDLISLFPSVEQTFRDIIEDWILVEHNTTGTHKQVTLDDIAEPTIAADLVGIWHESGVLKTRFATGTVYDMLTSETGLLLAGGTMTGDLVLSGAPDADLKAATKKYVDDADVLKADLAGPTFTGDPKAPTASAGDDSTSIATTAFVQNKSLVRETAINTTSGTTHGWTSIPAGTNRITLMLDGVKINASENILAQLGDSGGYETSSYDSRVSSGSASTTSTEGFLLNHNKGSTLAFSGSAVFERLEGKRWVCRGCLAKDGTGGGTMEVCAGNKTLSLELDRFRIKTTSGSFNAGKANILIEV